MPSCLVLPWPASDQVARGVPVSFTWVQQQRNLIPVLISKSLLAGRACLANGRSSRSRVCGRTRTRRKSPKSQEDMENNPRGPRGEAIEDRHGEGCPLGGRSTVFFIIELGGSEPQSDAAASMLRRRTQQQGRVGCVPLSWLRRSTARGRWPLGWGGSRWQVHVQSCTGYLCPLL